MGVWNGWGYGIAFFRALKFQFSEPEILQKSLFLWNLGIFLQISASEKYFSDSGKLPFHTLPIHTPTKCLPSLGSSQNLVVCNFYAEALFCAHLRPSVSFKICALLRTCICVLLHSVACFCVRPRLGRPRLGTGDFCPIIMFAGLGAF